MRITNFIFGVVFFVISIILSILCYGVYGSIQDSSGAEVIALIVIIPFFIIMYGGLLLSLVISSLNAIRSIGSDNNVIKIIAIIISILDFITLIADIILAIIFLS